MGDIEAEARAAVDWFDGLVHHHETSAAQAAATAPTAAPTEEQMDIAAKLHEIITEVETIGEELLTDAKTVAANPATAPAIKWLSTLAGLNIDPTIITKGLGAIEALHIAYQPLVAQQAQAAAEAAAAEAAAQQQAA